MIGVQRVKKKDKEHKIKEGKKKRAKVGPELPNAHALNPWGFSTLTKKGSLNLQHSPPLPFPCV